MSSGTGAGTVREAQRTKILETVAVLVAERPPGAAAVTTEQAIAQAGVSSAEFLELFADLETCLLAAFELGVQRAGMRMAQAYAAEPRWRDGVKGGLATLLRFLEEEPALARLCVVHSLGAGADVLRRRMEVQGALAAVVDRGRQEAPSGKLAPDPIVAEGIVGAVVSVIQNRLLSVERQPLMGLFGSLMSIIVLPYLGSAAARRELHRPPPRRWSAVQDRLDDATPARRPEPDTRLTRRTARVLAAIAEYPGASNREVAERAGVIDQGQISKLLSRLESRELIVRLGGGPSRGAPNAWCLTEHGEWLASAGATRLRSVDAKGD
ncbi:MAG TPA: helix-turn-helix domain-containing protein [Solirubrobacteraceae bacterium]|nr:helix-turn-helix domain-containing protein [Solirubrobacteraceae bacterium]